MSHENSITIQKPDGTWVNISSNIDGKSSPRKAEQLFRAGKRRALGGKSFASEPMATKAAKVRSRSFDKTKPISDLRKRKKK